MKRILGLDLGTNSIGWAVVVAEVDNEGNFQLVKIDAAGSRIIPMDATMLGDFDKGNSISQTAERTRLRGVRHLLQRCLLRRERLHRVLDIMGFLPIHYLKALNRYGQIKEGEEPKLAWRKNYLGKYEFLFIDSFNEMLEDFRLTHPEFVGKKVPYDWTIYYLRKKALTQKIAKEELAWVLLNFNQKRGYYQLRGEEEESATNKKTEYVALKVVAVEDSGEKRGKDTWYNVHLENGWIYRRTSSMPLDWVGKIKEFIVTTDVNDDSTPKTDKEGNIKRSFRSPKEDDWTLIKERTQSDIEHSGKTVGAYIYDSILKNPNQKVRGKLVRTIERKFYKEELFQILNKQREFHPELQDKELYNACIEELYSSNEAYRQNIAGRDFSYLFVDDILFYQRPLKTKKSLIADCP
ncbi:MAG: type II CRISPR RNA-guided endonuclease Cas9, partial [Bacteroidaceae bacterium]|nr:type II CRISPR RNA-guided endonuclease Cas9 [Bacteroidaceae bacterium]